MYGNPLCKQCRGKRLNNHALSVTIQDKTIYDIADLSVKHALEFFNKLTITDTEKLIAQALLKEIITRLTFT